METGQTEPLGQELHQAEMALELALAKACASKPVTAADTGELIRVEEVLQVASEAAKRAISLRQKRRSDRTQRAARWIMGDAEAAANLGAAHRTFADTRGVWWDVFAVYPEPRLSPHSQLKGTFQQGWLCFDSGTEKRRLSPIPDDWQRSSDSQLETLLTEAQLASSRRKRPPRDTDEDEQPR